MNKGLFREGVDAVLVQDGEGTRREKVIAFRPAFQQLVTENADGILTLHELTIAEGKDTWKTGHGRDATTIAKL